MNGVITTFKLSIFVSFLISTSYAYSAKPYTAQELYNYVESNFTSISKIKDHDKSKKDEEPRFSSDELISFGSYTDSLIHYPSESGYLYTHYYDQFISALRYYLGDRNPIKSSTKLYIDYDHMCPDNEIASLYLSDDWLIASEISGNSYLPSAFNSIYELINFEYFLEMMNIEGIYVSDEERNKYLDDINGKISIGDAYEPSYEDFFDFVKQHGYYLKIYNKMISGEIDYFAFSIVYIEECGGTDPRVFFIEEEPPTQVLRIIPDFFFTLCKVKGIDPWNYVECPGWYEVTNSEQWIGTGEYQYIAEWDNDVRRRGVLSGIMPVDEIPMGYRPVVKIKKPK